MTPRARLFVSLGTLALVACGPAASPQCPTSPTPSTVASTAAPTTATPATPEPVVSGYEKPPQAILDVLHAPSPPDPILSPERSAILLVSWVDYPPITRVAEPYLGLAGVRIEPKNRRRHDTHGGYGIAPCARGMSIVRIADASETKVSLPAGCIESPIWSADGARVAFRSATDQGIELWVLDAKTGETHHIAGANLNPMLGYTMQWLPSQTALLVKLVPDTAGTPPPSPVAPISPSTQETNGQKGESSTYEASDTLSY